MLFVLVCAFAGVRRTSDTQKLFGTLRKLLLFSAFGAEPCNGQSKQGSLEQSRSRPPVLRRRRQCAGYRSLSEVFLEAFGGIKNGASGCERGARGRRMYHQDY